jgi:hypothetical protein
MAQKPLPQFTLDYDERKSRWELTNDKTNRVVKSFGTKAAATKGGALRRAVGRMEGRSRFRRRTVGSKKSVHIRGVEIRRVQKDRHPLSERCLNRPPAATWCEDPLP